MFISAKQCRDYANQSDLLGTDLTVPLERRSQAVAMGRSWTALAVGIERDDALQISRRIPLKRKLEITG